MTMAPPRLPLQSSGTTTGDTSVLLGKLENLGLDLTVIRTVANVPHALRPFTAMSRALMAKAAAPPAVREVMILRLAVRQSSSYEWAEHVTMSADAGVTDEQRAAIAADRLSADLFDADQLLGMRLADALIAGPLGDDLWAEAVAAWGEVVAAELVLVVAWWGGFVTLALRGFGLEDAHT